MFQILEDKTNNKKVFSVLTLALNGASSWFTEITTSYPNLTTRTNHLTVWNKYVVSHTTLQYINSDFDVLTEILKSSIKKRSILWYKIVSKDAKGNQIDAILIYPRERSVGSHLLGDNIAFYNGIVTRKGNEVWSIFGHYPTLMQKLHEDLFFKDLHFVFLNSRRDSIKNPDIGYFYLSPLDINIMLTAYRAGYYDWPKKVNLSDLSKLTDLSKKTIDRHLRKCQRFLIANYTGGDIDH